MSSLNFAAALGTMRAIAEYTNADFDALGIQPADFSLTYDNVPWTRDNRRRVTATLDALIFGTLDVMGLPRIQVPAEFVAPIISVFVSPLNRMVACSWMAETGRASYFGAADDLSSSQGGSIEAVTASQLFALVIRLHENDPTSSIRQAFQARMDERVANLMAGV